MKTLTEYLKSYSQCPVCDSDTIVGESFNLEGRVVEQEVHCLQCSASWVDQYQLTGYSNLSKDSQIPCCPKCNSDNVCLKDPAVFWQTTGAGKGQGYWKHDPSYDDKCECRDCDHVFYIPELFR